MTAEVQVPAADEELGYRERFQTALSALDGYGVSEEMVREKSGFPPARWEQVKISFSGCRTIELIHLADALFVDFAYLLSGDDQNRVKFSPCSWLSIIHSAYPQREIQP